MNRLCISKLLQVLAENTKPASGMPNRTAAPVAAMGGMAGQTSFRSSYASATTGGMGAGGMGTR
jgi:hypothetical protein